MQTKTIRAALAAICVVTTALSMSASATTAVWKNNADGNLSDPANWVDGYVPKAGDTIDFTNVTAKRNIYNDLTETVQYGTVVNHNNVMFRRREGCSDWCFDAVTFNQSGSNGGLGGGDANNAARLTVAGRLTLAGQNGVGTLGGNDIVTADEIVKDRSGDVFLVKGALRTNLCVFKARQFVQSGASGFFALGTRDNIANYGLDVVVGNGGLKTRGELFFAVAYQTTVIHPSADYSFGANEHVDNAVMVLYAGTTLKIHTTDYNDGVTPRTVTFEGGVAARKSGSPYGKLQILGTGVVDFSSCRESSNMTMPETTVSDTATLLVKDTSIIGSGAMSFASGTTLKVEQTSANGIVELGGALSLAANSTLDFDLAANATTSALRVASLTLPASGTVKVKAESCGIGEHCLVENLPIDATVDNFSLVDTDSATVAYLLVVDGKLILKRAKRAVWKNNADGDLSVAENWVDGYVPQPGDAMDFKNVTAKHNVYNDLTATVQYGTVVNHNNVMFRRREGCSDWCFDAVTFNQSGSNGGLGGGDANNAARLTVAGRLAIAGPYGVGTLGGNDIVTADEIVKTRSDNVWLVKGALRTNLSVFKARQFVQSGTSGYFALGTYDNNANYGLDVVVGNGGLKTRGELFFAVAYRTTVIHPSADYSFGANEHVDNAAMVLYAGTTLKIHTTDYNDGVTPRTVTFEGGVAARKSGSPYGKLQILGTGVVDFSSCRESSNMTMPETTVSDTATLLVKDTSIIGSGAMSFASGTTLKVEQTSADGIVELGGALTLAANTTLEFDLAENSAASALRVATLTMPASGKVRVKASGVSRGGSAVLIDNLPAGIRSNQFELVEKPYDNATLVVRGNKLMVEKSKGLVIVIAGGKTSSPAPVAAKILFAGDSTLDDYGRVVNPYASWGTTLEDFMRSGCSVDNYAKSGASTKSFRANGYWSSLLAAIRPGDFVGIQFGHNDQKAGSNFAAPDGLFRSNVRQFVSEVRALGGKPILLSPIVRGTFDDDGNLYETQLDNGTRLSQYATAMRELSVELGTDFVDMNALTHDLLVELGKEESAKLFAASAGKSGDYTHPIPAGADAFARLFVKNVKDRGLEVAALFT